MQISDMAAIQRDDDNGMARELVPLLVETEVDPFTAQGRDLLRGWDFSQSPDSAAAAYFNAVWAVLLELTFADEVPREAGCDGGDRWFEVVHRLLDRPKIPGGTTGGRRTWWKTRDEIRGVPWSRRGSG